MSKSRNKIARFVSSGRLRAIVGNKDRIIAAYLEAVEKNEILRIPPSY